LSVDRRTILLRDPIRTLGTFEVPVRIAPKVEPKVKVTLVANQEGAAAEQAEPVVVEVTEDEEAASEEE
jgi:large subunit ribosomal protein L9